MKSRVELSEYVEWDVYNWSQALDYWQAHSTQAFASCRVLEIGSRHGGLSLWMAQQGAKVICSDLYGPSELAKHKHAQQNCATKITYLATDATALPFEGQFDIILFKSVLGALGTKSGQGRAVAEVYRALKPGGELFFAENLQASPLHRFFRRHCVPWASYWRYVTRAEMGDFLAPFSRVDLHTTGFAAAFGRTEQQRSLLGWSDQLWWNRLAPSRWHYIIIGIAKK
jgi:SAM-dependent methyltransferase